MGILGRSEADTRWCEIWSWMKSSRSHLDLWQGFTVLKTCFSICCKHLIFLLSIRPQGLKSPGEKEKKAQQIPNGRGNHFLSQLYNGLKTTLFRTADRKLYFHKWIYCAVLIPPVSVRLKKTVSKWSDWVGSFRTIFLHEEKFSLLKVAQIDAVGFFRIHHLTAKALEEACVWLLPVSPLRGEVFVFWGGLCGSPATGHHSFISILGSGLAYVTIASLGPHKISREMSIVSNTHPMWGETETGRSAWQPHFISTELGGKGRVPGCHLCFQRLQEPKRPGRCLLASLLLLSLLFL